MRDNLPYMARAGFEFLTAAHVRDIRFPLWWCSASAR